MADKYMIALFSLLLLPMVSYSNKATSRIEELEEAAHSKLLELGQIGEQIWSTFHLFGQRSFYKNEMYHVAKEKLEGVIDCEDQDLYDYIKKGQLKRTIRAGHNEEHVKTVMNEIRETLISIGNQLGNALDGRGSFEHDLTKEFFEQDQPFVGHYGVLKLIIIRGIIEGNYLIKHLVTRYQKCLQELIELNNELLTLKQKE